MKIEILRIIEDALIGCKNSEVSHIENNPLIAQLYREHNGNFKSFLEKCLTDEDKLQETEKETYTIITKKIPFDKNSDYAKEYNNAILAKNNADKKVQECLKNLAISISPMLAEISTYKIHYGQYSEAMEYSINAKNIEI